MLRFWGKGEGKPLFPAKGVVPQNLLRIHIFIQIFLKCRVLFPRDLSAVAKHKQVQVRIALVVVRLNVVKHIYLHAVALVKAYATRGKFVHGQFRFQHKQAVGIFCYQRLQYLAAETAVRSCGAVQKFSK